MLLDDPDGTAYADLDAATVRALCHRRRGVGADGVLRVVRVDAIEDGRPFVGTADWFMDFRNADGSTGEMCGNGVRVFARYLLANGVVDAAHDLPVATRAGVKPVRFEADGMFTVDMGPAGFPATEGLVMSAGGRSWPATSVDMGNPHGVAFVDDLADPGALLDPPTWTPAEAFPKGVNVEFAVRRGDRHLALRVHERGVGENQVLRHRRLCGRGDGRPGRRSHRPCDLPHRRPGWHTRHRVARRRPPRAHRSGSAHLLGRDRPLTSRRDEPRPRGEASREGLRVRLRGYPGRSSSLRPSQDGTFGRGFLSVVAVTLPLCQRASPPHLTSTRCANSAAASCSGTCGPAARRRSRGSPRSRGPQFSCVPSVITTNADQRASRRTPSQRA